MARASKTVCEAAEALKV